MAKPLSELTLEELWELFPVILKKHNPEYVLWYEVECKALQNLFGDNTVKRISHIGSTAVPGLIAKPTVDILLEVDPNCNIETLSSKLQASGWMLMQQKENPFQLSFNKGYTPEGFAERVYHLHVRHPGDWDELYFRDYLIEHPKVADAYGSLKLELKQKLEHDRDGYTGAKTDFVKTYSALAKQQWPGRYEQK